MDLIEQAALRLEELKRAGVVAASGTPKPDRPVREPQKPAVPARKTAAPTRVTAPEPASSARSRRINLDMAVLAKNGVVTPVADRSSLADELRVLKRPLLRNVAGKSAAPIKNANLIMITSALPAEGKTHLATNLAISIAMELDHTVLLVDADVARPSVPARLGIENQKGLLDVLLDKSIELSQVLLRTNIEKLSILPAGTQHPRATELLASEAMTQLLENMAERYADRIVIFDSPPLLVTTESRALATHMGQVVLVVKAESTLQSDIQAAVAALESCPVKMVILNGTHEQSHGYGYGYGYGKEPDRETQR